MKVIKHRFWQDGHVVGIDWTGDNCRNWHESETLANEVTNFQSSYDFLGSKFSILNDFLWWVSRGEAVGHMDQPLTPTLSKREGPGTSDPYWSSSTRRTCLSDFQCLFLHGTPLSSYAFVMKHLIFLITWNNICYHPFSYGIFTAYPHEVTLNAIFLSSLSYDSQRGWLISIYTNLS